jgi:hypothetical protein
MQISLGRAALLADVSKNTIARAFKSGKLTATKGRNNRYYIDEEELRRVFNLPQESRWGDSGADSGLKREIEGLRAQLEEMRAQLDDLRRERDDWKARSVNSDRLMEALILKATPQSS